MQGRFKRDGSAAAEPEPRGATDRGTPVDAPNGGEPTERSKGKSANSTGSRIALRNWRISTRLVSLLALPVVAATTLGALRIDTSLDNVDQLDHMKLLTEMTGKATALANALQEERDKSAGPLNRDPNSKDDAVVSSRQRTDRNIEAFRETTRKARPNDPTMVGVQSTLVDITRELDKIKKVRESAYKDREYIAKTVGNYNTLINSLLSLSQDMAQATSNSEMITATRALATFSSAKEYASIQRAVLSAALANPKGAHLGENDHQYGQSALSNEEQALIRFTAIRSGDSAELLKSLNGATTDITAANTFATRAFGNTNSLKDEKTSYRDWYDQDTVKITEMVKIETTLLNQMEQKAAELRDEASQEAILNGVLIVLVLGISLVGAFVVARSMVRSLRRLQDTAQKVAQERLPELVKQLSETDPQDVDTSVESVGVHSRDEIGKVAAAFDEVHREAVRLAAEQALLRGNVNAMFTNLSRRSQGLIQRQLSLISELESREADPDQLSSLFRLDHLATRMRRNGENLLVLAGEEPGRRWTRPVPLVDVLRAAASEVEQYERIELSGVPPTEVAGRVVNDLVHLLAELLENATSFSSPQTKVKVTGHALPDGRVLVEIHDTGIGLSPEDLAAINERLAAPPTVDVSVSRRMGLFVVGRLSLRHGIRIQLRPSDSGGTTALVMLPVDVAQGHKKPAPGAGAGAPGAPGAPAAGAGQQRHQVPGSGPRPALVPRGTAPGGGRPAQGSGPSGGAAAGSLFDTTPRDKGGPAAGGPGLPVRGNSGPAAVPPPAGAGGRPQLPARNAGGSAPAAGDAGRQAPAWGNAQAPAGGTGRKGPGAPVDDWPMADNGSARSGQDAPRGHDDTNNSGGRPAAQGNKHKRKKGGGQAAGGAQLSGGPGDTAQFPPVPAADQPPATQGRFAQPGNERPQPRPGDTAQFPPVPAAGEAPNTTTGSFELPGGPSATGQFARPAQNEQRNSTTGQHELPGSHGESPNGATGRFARPDAGGARDNGANGRFELPGGPAAGGRTDRPAPGGEGAGTPLFQELESHWFRDEAQPGVPQQPADSARPVPRRAAGRTPAPAPAPQNGPQGGGPLSGGPQAAATEGDRNRPQDAWPGSPNDERWKRAEQVREPAAGGTTSSGLPRRVPRANLVEGTAETQTQSLPTGPQVSRAPDDVRGRLTNLRRGIQQGRQAGNGSTTGSHNVGPTYQQER
ncbi:sensor histidine kinase [Streptomyces griseocarneus]|uniref:sensor histidine kinase n=1 Tax=Streptomyces griseocarneus TaxID=51201 RepID=UPI00167C6953|nr:nitrate- and nitrite sensing domain-containing protein [Streptomyces griseocarneus]MBZ6477223.1 nitrate- and nitrite sensing domain-containing protein [Streptomyces griseocarneus]GHG55738.1 histidine kinase [Streptomyces griseocarneus]